MKCSHAYLLFLQDIELLKAAVCHVGGTALLDREIYLDGKFLLFPLDVVVDDGVDQDAPRVSIEFADALQQQIRQSNYYHLSILPDLHELDYTNLLRQIELECILGH